MRVALVGAELEENLGLRYIAASLEHCGHEVDIVSFNSDADIPTVIEQVMANLPAITGFSMVFTGRAKEFCRLAQRLRESGYRGHLIAGGHFASFNCESLLRDFPAFDSVGLGEGEELLCALAQRLDHPETVSGLCYRARDGTVGLNPSRGNPADLDALPFPKRTTFYRYFDRPIASILSSRGCWRHCAFCSINAWYKRGGGKKFRLRSVPNIVSEMKQLYHRYGVRIFNFQDDNFFLPNPQQALRRFQELHDGLQREAIDGIAIAIKARPDSITHDAVRVLDALGLFRVFLGVENASEEGLRNLNRKSCLKEILQALEILNDFDVHVAYNLLMFEPDTRFEHILTNLRFIERHHDNPFNFCRAEAYAGTGLESKLLAEHRFLGNYFGFDYRLKDARSEAFHQIANYAFFDRNFSDLGLHYFNMQVDFSYQLLRRFHPELLSQSLRASVRNFIKHTNLDTYECLCEIYDFVERQDPADQTLIKGFARDLRIQVDQRSKSLHLDGEAILDQIMAVYERRGENVPGDRFDARAWAVPMLSCRVAPYRGISSLEAREPFRPEDLRETGASPFRPVAAPVPYDVFKNRMTRNQPAVT